MNHRGLPSRRSHRDHAQIIQIGRPVDIVLNPADNYVAEFNAYVPLLRLLTVRDVMEEAGPDGEAGVASEEVAPDTALQDLVPRLAAGVPGFVEVGENGRGLGSLKAAAALKLQTRDGTRQRPR